MFDDSYNTRFTYCGNSDLIYEVRAGVTYFYQPGPRLFLSNTGLVNFTDFKESIISETNFRMHGVGEKVRKIYHLKEQYRDISYVNKELSIYVKNRLMV